MATQEQVSQDPETSSPDPAIEINRVSKQFEDGEGGVVEALRSTSLDIMEGEFVVVVGPSGCGKSTLLNMLGGFESPSAGQLRVNGEPISGPNIQRGMVFQDYALFPWLNVIDNVMFGLRKTHSKAEARETAMKWLELVGLSEFAQKHPEHLSGGMKQRVAIARTFATDPKVILMDEPFGALDALTRRFLQQQLLKIWSDHRKTAVFITHSVQEAVYLATRVIVMTARPGHVKLDKKIDLPYPRKVTSAEFRENEATIFEALDEELAKTFSLDSANGFAD
jgi:ABC-type nitrate/sulfonate/bicarbonate transport system ATPase subunit